MFSRRKAALSPDADPRPYLLRLLTGRDYSRAQLESKARLQGYNEARVREALDLLSEQQLFRENAFMSSRIRALIHRGYGPLLIRARLRQERTEASDDDIAREYEALGTSPQEQVRELVRRSVKVSTRLKDELNEAAKRKIAQSISAKGHSLSMVLKEVQSQTRREARLGGWSSQFPKNTSGS